MKNDSEKYEILSNDWKSLIEKMNVEEIKNQIEINQNIEKQTKSFVQTTENQNTIETIINISNHKTLYLTRKLKEKERNDQKANAPFSWS